MSGYIREGDMNGVEEEEKPKRRKLKKLRREIRESEGEVGDDESSPHPRPHPPKDKGEGEEIMDNRELKHEHKHEHKHNHKHKHHRHHHSHHRGEEQEGENKGNGERSKSNKNNEYNNNNKKNKKNKKNNTNNINNTNNKKNKKNEKNKNNIANINREDNINNEEAKESGADEDMSDMLIVVHSSKTKKNPIKQQIPTPSNENPINSHKYGNKELFTLEEDSDTDSKEHSPNNSYDSPNIINQRNVRTLGGEELLLKNNRGKKPSNLGIGEGKPIKKPPKNPNLMKAQNKLIGEIPINNTNDMEAPVFEDQDLRRQDLHFGDPERKKKSLGGFLNRVKSNTESQISGSHFAHNNIWYVLYIYIYI